MVDEVIEQAFAAALDPMLIADDAQRIVDLNAATTRLFGYEREELAGHRLEDIVAPRQRERLGAAWTEFMLAGGARAEWLVQTRDGAMIEVDVSAAANVSAGRHLFVLRDITGRKRAEAEALRRADQQEAAANIGRVALTDVAGPALMQLAAEEISRVMGTALVSVFELHAAGRDLALRAGTGLAEGTIGEETIAGTASKGGYVISAKEPVVTEDLSEEDRFEAPPILLEHGVVSTVSVAIEGGERPFGIICASTRERREFTADDLHFLGVAANILGAALARERLRRLEAQLEQSRRLESIGQLAGGIAHDFNNLLGVITSYASFALEELDPRSQLHRDISEVVTAAEHGADLTKQLLLFASRQVVQTRTVDPNDLIRSAGAILDRALGSHIELRMTLADEIPPVRLGHGQLEQILMNLAMNARDAMPEGGELKIETELVRAQDDATAPGDAAGEFVRLSVADTGLGMSTDVARQAFEPFFTTKDRSQGTGLGLATVYGVAQAAGGWVRIDSEVGRGTAIHVYLPASDEAAAGDVARGAGDLRTVRGRRGHGLPLLRKIARRFEFPGYIRR